MKASALFQVFPTSGVPLYRQLMDQVRTLIASGRLQPGDRLPSVRDVAEDLQINPMTVSKAWSLLERDGVLEHIRGHGMEVRQPGRPAQLADRLAALGPALEQLVAAAFQLNLSREQVLSALEPLLNRLNPSASDVEVEDV